MGSNNTTVNLATSRPSTRMIALIAVADGFMIFPGFGLSAGAPRRPIQVSKQDEVGSIAGP